MLTEEDIKRLKETLVTKEDLAKIVTLEEFDRFRVEVRHDLDALYRLTQNLLGIKLEY